MTAICERCRCAVHLRHTRGTKLKDCRCPWCQQPGLLYAACVGHNLYQARSKPELQFGIRIRPVS